MARRTPERNTEADIIFHDGPCKSLADAEYATAGWVDWYKNRRLHSTLAMVPPFEFEKAHYAAQPRAAARMRAAENLGRLISCG